MSRSRARLALALAAALVVGGGLAGCSHASYSLQTGQCFNASANTLTSSTDVNDLSAVSCSHNHNSEVVGVHKLPKGDYPGQDVLVKQAQSDCEKDFRDYVGIGYEESTYDLYPLVPTESTWKMDSSRSIMCVALSLPPTKGSAKDRGDSAKQH
ncbi:MAG: septum formation family protein [Actinomycetaceae bacterium]|nr:septum formation family protein [Actinomycetaceae bacterium]MDU0971139.1 septum formation family protein [Actinomycetaceae bacterium]